ncbi:nucleotidyltransferase domain-containing protein [Candidatus Aminicenantes bacterium AC-335-K20]|jgi:hypothetical protein|nr:nucleotidyltransferase domain-containing protein [SCandidatus Aminicenantes bacterium Aminicenantia_JdfR_composite]MCP2597219.1 nucleotidyltransferase domain-containing protein [Candidatus Aminicenantes bacterium AC-335-G13]MCP2598488.1 nucleotidyltransferase domain-containing protein [Candidatus Aminicenantes bacterium AC-335-L06]MCP2619528.1 nucleotidyltransferase domain-containing protein [Candidatus Aminicenantes bacterium AC-335-K20]MCP2621187.1 nucleotidyltransferase domain-containing 
MEAKALTRNEVMRILHRFKNEVKNTLKDKFIELILFGSYARGDYEFGSDIDVLLVIKEELTKEEKEKISELSCELSLEYETVITCFYYLLDAFENWETPFLMNIRKEGIRI